MLKIPSPSQSQHTNRADARLRKMPDG